MLSVVIYTLREKYITQDKVFHTYVLMVYDWLLQRSWRSQYFLNVWSPRYTHVGFK